MALISVRRGVDSRAIMKQSGFVPATFRIVALCTGVIVTTTNLLNSGLNALETVEDVLHFVGRALCNDSW